MKYQIDIEDTLLKENIIDTLQEYTEVDKNTSNKVDFVIIDIYNVKHDYFKNNTNKTIYFIIYTDEYFDNVIYLTDNVIPIPDIYLYPVIFKDNYKQISVTMKYVENNNDYLQL